MASIDGGIGTEDRMDRAVPFSTVTSQLTGITIDDTSKNTVLGLNSGIYISALPASNARNTIVGANSAVLQNTGNDNTVIGCYSMRKLVTGNDNTVIGGHTLNSLSTGSGNVVVGANAADNLVSGDYNVIIGKQAGCFSVPTTGSNNIIIGPYATVPAGKPTSGAFVIANNATTHMLYGLMDAASSGAPVAQSLEFNGVTTIRGNVVVNSAITNNAYAATVDWPSQTQTKVSNALNTYFVCINGKLPQQTVVAQVGRTSNLTVNLPAPNLSTGYTVTVMNLSPAYSVNVESSAFEADLGATTVTLDPATATLVQKVKVISDGVVWWII